MGFWTVPKGKKKTSVPVQITCRAKAVFSPNDVDDVLVRPKFSRQVSEAQEGEGIQRPWGKGRLKLSQPAHLSYIPALRFGRNVHKTVWATF